MFDTKEYDKRMHSAVDNLKKEFAGLRTGRASANMLDPITVDVYGSRMPLNQVASVTAPEARLLNVQVWDSSNASAVEKAIRESSLGLNPASEGAVIRVPLPDLTAERRVELSKVAGKYAEQSRIAVRNIRRDAMDSLKKLEKDSDISEDEQKRFEKEVQDLTDKHIKTIDTLLTDKDKDIQTV